MPSNHFISVGVGYSDASPKQIVRTSQDIVYIITVNCDSYPNCSANGLTQNIKVYKANSDGIPTGFTPKSTGTVMGPGVMGWAAVIDDNDDIHVVWCSRESTDLTRYLRYNIFHTSTDTWEAELTTILSNLDDDDIGQGDESVSVAIDSGGNLHVVFLTTVGSGLWSDRRIYYTNNVGGSWATAIQLDSGVTYSNQKAWHPNIAIDYSGRLLVGWMRGTFSESDLATIYIRTRETNGTWGDLVSVATNQNCGIDTDVSFFINADGVYHLTFLSAKGGDGYGQIRYFYSSDNGASWTEDAPPVVDTNNITLGPNGSGGVRAYHHGGGTPWNIYYLENAGVPDTWGDQTLYASNVGNTFDCSVSARWQTFFHHFPNTIDLIYWDNAYPNILYMGCDKNCDTTITETSGFVTTTTCVRQV